MKRFRAALGSLLFFVIAPGTLAAYLPWLITDWQLKTAFLELDALRVVGAAFVFLGLVAVVESFARFVWKGFGTPAPVAAPIKLVVTGFYRWVRNPIYVGVVAIEEPSLGLSFGDEFAIFKANVPRWLPRLKPWRPFGASR